MDKDKSMHIFKKLSDNKAYIDQKFNNVQDLIKRDFKIGGNETDMYLIYIDNIVSTSIIGDFVMTSLMLRADACENKKQDFLNYVREKYLSIGEVSKIYTFSEVFSAVLIGDSVLFSEGCDYALQVSTKLWPYRGVPKAETEVVVEGPKDAFCEAVSINVVLVRRRIRDTRLKMKRLTVGRRSRTIVSLLYLEDVARDEVVKEIEDRINALDIDAVFDSGQLQQFIEHKWYSPFPQMQLTERPDKAAAAITEGRVVLIVDNTPFAIILPVTLNVFFQSAEDYYDRSVIMSAMRIMRYFAAFLAISFSGLYIAITTYSPYVIPTSLCLKIASSREIVPFPTVVEVLLMEGAFELLREAGIRLPAPVSSTIGIVGGIIIGQAAVQAGLVQPVVVIVGAFTAICTFVIPNNALVSGIRISKYIVILLSAFFGLYGFTISLILILIHITSLKSFDIPYLFPYSFGPKDDLSDFKDSFIRAPFFKMAKRPIFAKPSQKYRSSNRRGKK